MGTREDTEICVVGLGYVGLPLALAIAESRMVIGVDKNSKRIDDLNSGKDLNLQFSNSELIHEKIKYQLSTPQHSTVYILTLPTPVNQDRTPNLEPLTDGIRMVGLVLKQGDLVIIESTVYPGVTEDVCAPILESISGLKRCVDFSIGYSPERINPGDSAHDIRDVTKVVSGCCDKSVERVSSLYSDFVKPGVFKATSIRVAEAAKVIENTQRDLNIALVNELAMLFNKLDIDTNDVLEAASTKWNFHGYRPGLVGGHCIGVDPYYLTYKAMQIGFNPEIILAGRKINDQMPLYVANRFQLAQSVSGSDSKNVLILGLTFKEDCPDFRNSGAVVLANELTERGFRVFALDPYATDEDVPELDTRIEIIGSEELSGFIFDGIILSVAHKEFEILESKLRILCPNGPIMDIKSFYHPDFVDLGL
jgi:UDP-N-acetyl-D-galactosamine dehydrogenase